ISPQKFQQKALQQAKQKKSKSAEFLMVGKDERVAAEGTANPAFNISCTDLSAYQTSEEEVIRHDKLDSTLAAHREKRRLQTRNEPRGNECSRNYFDPLMDEEINPRQCGMEVTKEVPVKLDERLLYDKLMTFLDEENRKLAIHDTFSSAWPFSGDETCDLAKEVEDEETLTYTEQFDNDVQDEIILLSKFSLEQVRKKYQHPTPLLHCYIFNKCCRAG
uniref:OFCC1 n=1 Tax=Varanus komodoensis TaxID=61221 RepID=A0A8D2LXN1_VARKO